MYNLNAKISFIESLFTPMAVLNVFISTKIGDFICFNEL
jgi:hypothetical protein